MPVVLVGRELGQQGAEGGLGVADETEVDLGPSAQLLSPDIDLDDRRLLGEELLVREVGADHQQDIAGHHGVVAGREAEETGQAHVERIVVLDELLPSQRVHDRRVQSARELDQLGVRAGAPGAPEDRDPLRAIQQRRERGDLLVGRAQERLRLGKCQARSVAHRVVQGDIARQDDDRDAAARHRGLHRDLERARHLLRVRHQLAVVATLREEVLRVGLLEVSAADLIGGDLRGNGENGYAAPVAIVEPVDQVEVARAAAAGADGELAGEVRLGARGEGRRLFVPHVDPSKLVLPADGVGDPVERVSRDPIDPRDPSADEGVHEQVRDALLSHGVSPLPFDARSAAR